MPEDEKPAEKTDVPKQEGVAGRPPKFKSYNELKSRIDQYFQECDPHLAERMTETGTDNQGNPMYALRKIMTEQIPYGVIGLAVFLETTRETLNKYESGDYDDKATDYNAEDPAAPRFSDAIKEAKEKIRSWVEGRLFQQNSTGAIFWLKNNDGDNWKDRQEIDHTSKGKRIKSAPTVIVSEVAPRATDQAQAADGSSGSEQPED